MDVSADQYFGKGYQDVTSRVPCIENGKKYLGWTPQFLMAEAVKRTLAYHLTHPDEELS